MGFIYQNQKIMNKVIGNADIMSIILSYHKPIDRIYKDNCVWYFSAECLNNDSLSCDYINKFLSNDRCGKKVYPYGAINQHGVKYCRDCVNQNLLYSNIDPEFSGFRIKPIEKVLVPTDRVDKPIKLISCKSSVDNLSTGELMANLFKNSFKEKLKKLKESMNLVDNNPKLQETTFE